METAGLMRIAKVAREKMERNMQPIIHTFFTPVYNRSNQMIELYESIMNIEYDRTAFERLIVDDGSTEDISKAIKVAENKYGTGLNIRIIRQEKCGVHIVQKTTIRNVCRIVVTRIDSDDRLLSNTLKVKGSLWDSIENRERFTGIVGICLHPGGILRSPLFPQDATGTTGMAARKVLNATGDRNFCMRMEVMREHYLPEHRVTKYVPEKSMRQVIDRDHLTRFSNVPLAVGANDSSDLMLLQFASENKTKSSVLSSYYGSYYLLSERLDMMELSEIFRHLLCMGS